MLVNEVTVRSFKIKHVKGLHRFIRELLQKDNERSFSHPQNGMFLAKVETSTPDGRNIVSELNLEGEDSERTACSNMTSFANRHNIRKNHIYFTTNSKIRLDSHCQNVEFPLYAGGRNLSQCIYVDSSNIIYGNGFTQTDWISFEDQACHFANNHKPKSIFE